MSENYQILCVEDNMADLGLLMEAFVELDLQHKLHHVIDGEQAMAYLRREGQYQSAELPNFILLDLNLPRKSGFEVLQEIALDARLRQLEIAVLTTTARESDVRNAAGGLNVHFITKPMDFDAFVEVVRRIDGLMRKVQNNS